MLNHPHAPVPLLLLESAGLIAATSFLSVSSLGLNLENLDEFMSTFDDYERHALKARNGICEEITQAWLEQAKKGAWF